MQPGKGLLRLDPHRAHPTDVHHSLMQRYLWALVCLLVASPVSSAAGTDPGSTPMSYSNALSATCLTSLVNNLTR